MNYLYSEIENQTRVWEPKRWVRVIGSFHVFMNIMGLLVFGGDFFVKILRLRRKELDQVGQVGTSDLSNTVYHTDAGFFSTMLVWSIGFFLGSALCGVLLILKTYKLEHVPQSTASNLVGCIATAFGSILWSLFCTLGDRNTLTVTWLILSSLLFSLECWRARLVRNQILRDGMGLGNRVDYTFDSKSSLLPRSRSRTQTHLCQCQPLTHFDIPGFRNKNNNLN